MVGSGVVSKQMAKLPLLGLPSTRANWNLICQLPPLSESHPVVGQGVGGCDYVWALTINLNCYC